MDETRIFARMTQENPGQKKLDINTAPYPNADLRQRLARHEIYVGLSAGWHWEQDENFRFTDIGVGIGWPAHAPPMGLMLGKARWETPGLEIEGGWEAHRDLLTRHLPYHNVEARQTAPDGSINVMRISGVPFFAARHTGSCLPSEITVD